MLQQQNTTCDFLPLAYLAFYMAAIFFLTFN